MIISHMPIAHDILERRSKLSPAKRVLLEKRVSGGFTGNSKSHIPRQPNLGLLPPSFGQQRVWFADQMEPNSAVYNRPAAVRLRGPLNVEALEQGLQEILARHEALRTTFPNVKGQLAQIISPPVPLHLPVVDLSRVSKPEQETQALRLVNEEARRPFDLVQGPLQRMNLLRLGEDEHILVLVIHHIVFDGWSLGVLFRELGVLYESFSERKPSPLTELPIQYADFAVWQRNYLQGEELEAQLAYWGKQLGGRLPVLQLPTDRPRAVIQTYHTGRHMLTLSRVLTGALKALSRSEEVTVYMTLLAAFQTLLHRYTSQEDILVGSPLAGRTRSETEGLIGFFVNTLVMRANLSGNPSFGHLLRRVRKLAVEAYAHQDLPFEKLVEVLQPERALGRMPLFNVMFQLRNIPKRELKLSGLQVEDFEFDRTRESLDLSLEMVEKAEELSCLFEYNSDLFDAATISRMAGHFQTLLNSIVTDAGRTLSGLSLLTEAEDHQLLVEWNDTKTKYPQDKCIHELFEQQVEQTPDGVAIVFENQQLTYGELNAKANQLARHLRRLGVGPEVLVGICLDRSLEMIVGVLSILKAGGAYVPLDPAYPSERLSFILEDAGVSLLLTQEGQLENLRCHSARVVCLDRDREVIAHERPGNVDSGVAAENSSHVIYTSGSTGRPKGVVLEHHNTCTLINWAVQTYTSEELAGVLASASICFDLSVFEIFVPLSCGGTIILADNALHLPTLLAAEKVTLVLAMPSALTELIRSEGIPSSVQTINSCGEVLQSALVQRIFQQANIKKVYNLYGPTEDAVCSTYSKISPEESPTIGRPIANKQIYILDRHLQPVPVGVQGELHIGGDGLARCYLNRPEVTAEKFVPNPFSAEQGARLYKTGDLACYRFDGNIEFLGRLDQQVKVRGYRVELGEVEAVLRQHPSVSEAVVLAQLDLAGNQRLVAYVVATRDAPSSSELRNFLKRKLPQHMVPSIFTPLQNLPLTPNGKVDRNALPATNGTRPELDENYVAPRSDLEDAVASIWRGLLGIGRIGVDDDFFDLGGHSLLAMDLVSRIRDQFQVEVHLRTIFENPTIASLTETIGGVINSGKNPASQPILPTLRNENVPLSFAQQRLWFFDQLAPKSCLYNITLVRHFNGRLDTAVLENSLNEIVRRHESLRTTFTAFEGEPIQVVSPDLIIHLAVIDLTQLPAGEQEAEAQQLAADEVRRPFDLSRGPLFRAALLRFSDAKNILLLTMHHIISDGWSLEVMLRELNLIYQAFSNGLPSPLSELPIQYADYAAWQRSWLQGAVLEKELAYWRDHLRDAPAVLELPTDRPRPAEQTFRGARHYFELSPTLSKSLHELCQRQGATLFMTLLAAFQVLLSRYTQQEDLVVGSVIAGRGRAEIEGLIGFFSNTLVLRSDLSGDPTFREVLSRVKAVTLGAYEHQDMPFEKLVEEFQPKRSLSHNPLFQAMFTLQNAPRETLELAGLTPRTLEIDCTTSKFDMTLNMVEGREGLTAFLEYNTDLFDAATIERMLGHFQVLMEGIVTDPAQHLSELPLLTPAERHQLLIEWNTNQAAYPKERCLHELFEAQVVRTPDRAAVVFENEQLSYGELNERANQLAHYLHSRGVGPDTLVGLCFNKSVEMIVAMLATLKAGGAYLPMDPACPQERLRFMLEDSGVAYLITTESLVDSLPRKIPTTILLDAERESIKTRPKTAPDSNCAPNNLIYCIYTSGSTGQPNGVLLEHRNVVRLLVNERQLFNFSEQDVWTMFHSYCFDFSVWEMYGALLYGGKVVIVAEPVMKDPSLFLELLVEQKVTVLNQTPTAFYNLAQEALRSGPAALSLRYVIFGGEALHPVQLKEWKQAYPETKLINMYGITETTVHVTYKEITDQDIAENRSNIGRPIPTTTTYVMDENLRLLPVGVPGEICVGGEGVARGYLGRDDLTRQKFVTNPYQPEERLYRSGDLAKLLPGGELLYLGRVDDQVQIRGFRVEPGEISSHLLEHPQVAEAEVLARKSKSDSLELIAYVVPRAEISVTALRSHLAETLPFYMVPTAFVMLDSLPLTANGKVDRKVLASADVSRDEVDGAYQPARTPVEEMIVEIWAGILGIKLVGIHDNFFELGGHSLIATRIMSRMREAFEVELPVRALFEFPTVAGQAERVEAAWQADRGLQAPALKSVSREQDLPLSFAQQRLWFLDQLEPNNPFYNVSQAISLRGLLDTRALAQTINTIVSRHESLRTTFQSVDGWPRQVIVDRVTMELPIRDLNHLRESERETEARRLATEEARRPFDLAAGPLMRASLVRLTEDDHVLLLTMHHIISDGWSLGILIRELGTLYEVYAAGQPSPLPELLIQYADYAVWQRQWLQGEVLEKQLAYWKERLGGDLPLLALPTDRPRPAVQTYGGSRQSIELPMRLVEQLRQLSQHEEATLYMLCLAAFQMLLSRYSGQEDIIVGSPIAGRNRAETEGLIGFFVNTLVMRTDLSGNPTFRELLGRVKEMTLGAYEHQDLPFEKLVEELQPERSLSYSPIFQVFFALQNANSKAAAPGQLKLGSFGFDNRTTRFDLEVHLGETADGTLNCTFVHNTDLFDAATVRRMITQYQTLLESVVAHPEEQICRLELLTEEEREQLLLKWNNTQTEYPRGQTIHRLFEAQVERTPDAVAAVFNDEQLTYRQLNERANQIGHYLQDLGVGPEVLVAICVNRSLEMVIGLLGILKAGGAYVPLDPDYPQERLSFIIEDAGALVLLTQKRLVENLPSQTARVVCLDRDFERINSESVENVNSAVGSNNLAYVIYTSGSTGRPKGVAIEHDSTVALLDWSKAVFAAEDLEGVLASTSICFDLSVFELFVTLTRGGKVIVALDALHLIELAAAQEIRLINTVPSAISELVRVGGIPSSVRTVNLAGEPLAQALVEQLYEQEGVERVFDLYGPSEDTTYSTYALRARGGVATIGRPISNTQVYILDKQMELAPIGVAGELYIGGDGLARGYLNRSELTIEKFIANPFSDDPTARLYRTGDVARYLADGNIEFLGRIDHQVKIRGYRIELGEIESVLNQHAGVSESVVVAKEYELGDKRLVAYVIGGGDERPSPSELRKHLKERLPDYMVPTAFVLLDKMPLTPNGKVNRKALLDSDETQPEIKETFVAPRNASEEVLAKIWGEILGLEQVGVFDNFFELGGHSLLATRVMSRVSDVFEIRVLLRAFFEQPTVAGLAELVSDAKKKHREPTPAIRRRPRA